MDEAYVELVGRRVTELYRELARKAAETIGRYLLDSFYGGSVEVYRRFGREHESCKALTKLPSLGMPRAAVWDALRYVEQLDQLPPEVGSVLTISHHRELYRVRDKQLKIRLARSAVRRGLKVRELRDHVRTALGPDERGRGRPKKTRFQKLVGDLEKATAAVAAEPLTSEDLAGLSPRQVTKLRRELQRQVLVLSRALAQVEELARR